MTHSKTTHDTDESTESLESQNDESDQTEVLYKTRPTIKPPAIVLGGTILGGGIIAGIFLSNIIGLPDPQLATVIGWITVFVVAAVTIKLSIRIYILTRTTYTVTTNGVHYEFTLWFRRQSQEVPFSQLRAHRLEQGRLQRLFNVGTVSVLTGGTNNSLGYIQFENVPNPDQIRDVLRSQATYHKTR